MRSTPPGRAPCRCMVTLSSADRDQTLVRFANGSVRVLVATDVAARGLDIKSLALVVNFQAGLGSGGACSPHRPYRPRR